MTLSTQTSRVSYNGDGTQTIFDVTFPFIENDHVEAVLRDSSGSETIWTENTDYALSGGNGSTGMLTATIPPAAGETLVIRRNVPLTQETDYPEGGKFPSESHELALDFARMVDQQQQEQLDRTLKLPIADPVSDVEIASVDFRKAKVLGFKSDGSLDYLAQLDQSAQTVVASGSTEARSLAERFGEVLNVRDFGAKGDGVTDDTAAFNKVRDKIEALIRINPAPGASSNKLSDVRVEIPAGDYLITAPEAFMRSTFTTRTSGLRIVGVGGVVQILYQPTTPGALFNFNDSFFSTDIEDIAFVCDDPNSDFFVATSSGGTQNLRFKRCFWGGQWQYCFRLRGTNNNSEYRWVDCAIGGTTALNVFLWLEESDQFLNYWFDRFSFTAGVGTWIRASKGGHIKLVNCDVSGWAPISETYLIELLGFSHSSGVTHFSATNLRVELLSDNAKVIKSEWESGNILFKGCDFGSAASTQTNTVENFFFNIGNTRGAVVSFEDCVLIGKANFEYNINAFGDRSMITFAKCTHEQHPQIDEFVTFTRTASHGNLAGQPVIHFDNCRGTGTDSVRSPWDSDFGWELNRMPQIKQRWMGMRTAQGRSPKANGTIKMVLPANAIILRIRTHVPASQLSAETYDFDIRTDEAVPTVHRNITGADASAGIDDDHSLFYKCGTDKLTRTVILEDKDNLSSDTTEFNCLIEYIG